jgi:hypothetical protein
MIPIVSKAVLGGTNMKTSFKDEIQKFEVVGIRTNTNKTGPRVNMAFKAEAKGRLVAWNNITGHVALPVALISSKGFGPKDISFGDIDWVVHIMRRGSPVTRAMKPTPRKNTINHALTHLLAPALVGADLPGSSAESRAKLIDKEVAPKVARSPRKSRAKTPSIEKESVERSPLGLVENLEAVGLKVLTEIPKAGDPLEMPEFLKR